MLVILIKNQIKMKKDYSFIITEKHPDHAITWNSEVLYSLMELQTISIEKKGIIAMEDIQSKECRLTI
jgi:hypothetical protein